MDNRAATGKFVAMEASANNMTTHKQNTVLILSLQKELMDLHDSIMPAMTKLMQLKRQLKIKLQDDRNVVDRGELKQIREAVLSLESADEAMMKWMRGYKTSFEGMTEYEIENYLHQERQLIVLVRQKMVTSIDKATVLLAKCNK